MNMDIGRLMGRQRGQVNVMKLACGEGIRGVAATIAQVVAGLSLFVIACVVSAGAMSPVAGGWCYFGLGGAGFALTLAKGNLNERKWFILGEALFTVAIVGVGLAGGLGAMTCKQLAWGYWGTLLAGLGLFCCGGSSVGSSLGSVAAANG